jgi:hypothetical protein
VAFAVRFARFACLVALAGCAHGDIFQTPSQGSDAPRDPAPVPVRLTYNPGIDRSAAWLPDESGLLYSADRLDRDDDDRCLVILPPAGGQVRRTFCPLSLASRDSTDTFEEPAINADGFVAFVRTSRRVGTSTPQYNALVAGDTGAIDDAVTLHGIPFTVNGQVYNVVSYLHWLSDEQLVYRAGTRQTACIGPTTPASPCPLANIETGRTIVLQGLDTAVPIAGLDYVSSVTVRDSDELLFTQLGDSRVFSYRLSTGATTIFYDFGTGIARDVQIAGSRLAAIVGGNVTVINPAFNPPETPQLQYDLGGDLVVVDLGSNVVQTFQAPARYRRPVLSPSGHHLVVESAGDLWRFDFP